MYPTINDILYNMLVQILLVVPDKYLCSLDWGIGVPGSKLISRRHNKSAVIKKVALTRLIVTHSMFLYPSHNQDLTLWQERCCSQRSRPLGEWFHVVYWGFVSKSTLIITHTKKKMKNQGRFLFLFSLPTFLKTPKQYLSLPLTHIS